MEGMLLPIVIAASIALLGWWVVGMWSGSNGGERRRLKQRLSTENTFDGQVTASRPITLNAEPDDLPTLLARYPFFLGLNRRLLLSCPELPLSRFLLIVAACAVVLGLAGFFLFESLPMGLGGLALGAYLPFMVLGVKRAKRQRTMVEQLPEALDFLSRVMRAGHSFSTGLQMMSEELPYPLREEFRRCYDQHSLGQSLEDSLKEMASRVDSTDFAFFVTAVLIQRQAGGDLSEVLDNIGGMIRARVRLQMSVRAKTAEGRLTGYIMTAFPGLMFCLAYYLNPEYGGVLLHTHGGNMLLGTAFGLAMLGLFMIKKIVTVKV